MSIAGYKRLVLALLALVVLLAALIGWLLWEQAWLRARLAFAEEQIEIFEEMRARALQSGPSEARGYLEYAVWYYPSGTKQEPDSRLDRIVERERSRAVQAIIDHLRSKTGKDLGNDPQRWIEDFPRK